MRDPTQIIDGLKFHIGQRQHDVRHVAVVGISVGSLHAPSLSKTSPTYAPIQLGFARRLSSTDSSLSHFFECVGG